VRPPAGYRHSLRPNELMQRAGNSAGFLRQVLDRNVEEDPDSQTQRQTASTGEL
jgi:hypothetical protein